MMGNQKNSMSAQDLGVQYTPVDPHQGYPFSTDEQFIKGNYPLSEYDDEQGHDDPEGMVHYPNLEWTGEGGTEIIEEDGTYFIVPTNKDLQNSGLHYGGFSDQKQAEMYELNYLTPQ